MSEEQKRITQALEELLIEADQAGLLVVASGPNHEMTVLSVYEADGKVVIDVEDC